MMSHSSHTIIVNELLILVILVASTNFIGSKFCHLRRSIGNDVTHRKIFNINLNWT